MGKRRRKVAPARAPQTPPKGGGTGDGADSETTRCDPEADFALEAGRSRACDAQEIAACKDGEAAARQVDGEEGARAAGRVDDDDESPRVLYARYPRELSFFVQPWVGATDTFFLPLHFVLAGVFELSYLRSGRRFALRRQACHHRCQQALMTLGNCQPRRKPKVRSNRRWNRQKRRARIRLTILPGLLCGKQPFIIR